MGKRPEELDITQSKEENRSAFLVPGDVLGTIDTEYSETMSSSAPNTWLECFGNCLSGLRFLLAAEKRTDEKKILSSKEINRRLAFCEKIYASIEKLQVQYHERDKDLPESVKDKLRKALLCLNDLSCYENDIEF